MRTYESIFIVHPEVVGDDQTAIIEKYKTILTDQGAVITSYSIHYTKLYDRGGVFCLPCIWNFLNSLRQALFQRPAGRSRWRSPRFRPATIPFWTVQSIDQGLHSYNFV